jgi:glutamate-5-semialdehyde dehydrogenase
MKQFLQEAVAAKRVMATLDGATRNKILHLMANGLEENSDYIVTQNDKDIAEGKENKLSNALMDRLLLNKQRIQDMAKALRDIAALKDPVNKILEGWVTEDGLNIQKVTVPIGVIGIIYESRPNVTSDTAGLCFKSGNVCILKGGKEAAHSNNAIADVLQEVLEKNNLPKGCVSLLPDGSREGVANLIKQDEYVDLIVPRGGEALIKYVSSNASVPVVKHDKGLCHTYVACDADIQKALTLVYNAKCRRTGICGALETLLVDEKIADEFLPQIKAKFDEASTEVRGCEKTSKIIECIKASQEDWETEYLDNIVSIKIINGVEEAVDHISEFGSSHSDAIITENCSEAEYFLNSVDSACVYLNSSTQFTDGGMFGFGAEVGISTNKLHARGPMGVNELTTYKYKIIGNGKGRK